MKLQAKRKTQEGIDISFFGRNVTIVTGRRDVVEKLPIAQRDKIMGHEATFECYNRLRCNQRTSGQGELLRPTE